MAYARFGEGSDVYVYRSMEGVFVCESEGRAFTSKSRQGMIDHLAFHVRRGQRVPQHAMDRLKAERDGIPYESDVERGLRQLNETCPQCTGTNLYHRLDCSNG